MDKSVAEELKLKEYFNVVIPYPLSKKIKSAEKIEWLQEDVERALNRLTGQKNIRCRVALDNNEITIYQYKGEDSDG